ncbi:MAG: bifunctional oligoribonuclease/PAP phosphatase NrnA [Anaeroplasmataceae bacterium]
MKNILKAIKKYNTIIIHGHEHPDGDCLGSQKGLKDIIKTKFPNKNVYVVGENSEYLSFLGEVDVISDDTYKGALAIVVDLANSERASDKRFTLADYTIKIDHHQFVEKYADYEYIESSCSSCSEIICVFARKYKLKMTLEGAKALYVGIVTDTGRFRFDSVNSRTHEMAAYLLDKGVNPAEIDNYLVSDTLEILKLKGYVLSNFQLTKANVAYVKMTRDVITEHNVTDEQAANMVNLIGTLKDVYVWFLVIEYSDGTIKVRLRSKGPVINTFASNYNGGGHPKASGAKLTSWDELDSFIVELDKLVMDYKNTI